MDNQKFIIIVLTLLAVAVGAVWVFNVNDIEDVRYTEDSHTSESYEVTYKMLSNKSLGAEDVNSYIQDRLDDLINIAEDHYQEVGDSEIFYKYTFGNDIETYFTENHISYVVIIGEYTGGANANSSVKTFVYEKSTGDMLTLLDLVGEEESQGFITDVRNALLNPEVSRVGVFEDVVETLTFNNLGNFYLESSFITLIFSQYEVAPGASGIVRIALPF